MQKITRRQLVPSLIAAAGLGTTVTSWAIADKMDNALERAYELLRKDPTYEKITDREERIKMVYEFEKRQGFSDNKVLLALAGIVTGIVVLVYGISKFLPLPKDTNKESDNVIK